MHSEGSGIWRENWKSRKMRNTHFRTWNMSRKTEKGGKCRNVHCRTWNMARKGKNHGKWETSTWRLEKWRNHWKTWKMKMHTVGPGIWQENWKSWKMRNIHLTTLKMTKSLKTWKMRNAHWRTWIYGEKTENHGTWEIHTLGREILRGKLKKVENLEMCTVGRGICQ